MSSGMEYKIDSTSCAATSSITVSFSDKIVCGCCEDAHGISSHPPYAVCGLCHHPLVDRDGKRFGVPWEYIDRFMWGEVP